MQANGHSIHADQRSRSEKAQHVWIDDDARLDEIMPTLLDAERLAVDTESNNYNSYNAQLCILQIAVPDALYVLDTLALSDGALQMLGPLFEDPYTTKVIHGADNDLSYLYNELGIRLQGLFDTILAARFLNLPKRGLGDLLERYFGVKSSKKFQRFDWSIRPLPHDALAYAMQDVRYTLPLHEQMCDDLREVDRLDAVVEESNALTERDFTPKAFDPHGYRRIKGAKSLDRKQEGVLYALYQWRHELCTELNRAAFMVVDNAALLALARQMPKSQRALSRVPRLPRPIVNQHADALIEVIAAGQKTPAPPRKRKSVQPDRRSRKERERQAELLERLKEWRAETAETQQFEIDLVALNSTLQHLSFDPPRDLDALADVPGMLPWRLQRFGDALLKICAR